MKKLLLLLFLIPTISFSAGDRIEETINEYITKNPSWADWVKNDRSVIFLSTRCAANFRIVSGRAANSDSTQAAAEQFDMYHKIFLQLGGMLSKASGISADNFNERYEAWINIYLNEGKDNMKKYNTFVDAKFAEDFDSCGKQVLPVIDNLIKQVSQKIQK
tara:strand:+ start:71 stop:553 length:483 start_codon:yes stop_codon:yes gene_type:complete